MHNSLVYWLWPDFDCIVCEMWINIWRLCMELSCPLCVVSLPCL